MGLIDDVINNANTPGDIVKGNKNIPKTFKLPKIKIPKVKIPKVKLPKARFLGLGSLGLAISGVLTEYEPLSDGTLPPWIVDVGNASQQIQVGTGSRPIQYNLYALFGKKNYFAGTYIDALDAKNPVLDPANHRGTFWGPITGVRLTDYKDYGYPGYLSYEVGCYGRTNTARKTSFTWVKVVVLAVGSTHALVSVKGWEVVPVDGTPDPPPINTQVTVNVKVTLDGSIDKLADAIASKIQFPSSDLSTYGPSLGPISKPFPDTPLTIPNPDIPIPDLPVPPPPEFPKPIPDPKTDSKGKTTIYPGGIDPKQSSKPTTIPTPTGVGIVVNPQPTPTPTPTPDPKPDVTPIPDEDKQVFPIPEWFKDFDPDNWQDTITPSVLAALTPTLINIQNQTTTDAIAHGTEMGICQSLNNPTACPVTPGNPNPTQGLGGAWNKLAAILGITDQATDLGILQIVKNINDVVTKGWNSVFNDKVLNALNTALIIHNGVMLSNNIFYSVTETVDNILEALNIKDKDGEDIDTGTIIANKIQFILQGLIGTENYNNLQKEFLKANRIYQASANLLSNVREIIDSTQNIAEETAENVAFIGNALKRDGVVRENSFNWMNPDVANQSSIIGKLEKIETITSSVEEISEDVLDISEEISDLKENREEFQKAKNDFLKEKIKDENKDKKDAQDTPEPTDEDEARTLDKKQENLDNA